MGKKKRVARDTLEQQASRATFPGPRLRLDKQKFTILALNYFPARLPLKYRHSSSVSQLSSRWFSVVPNEYKTPENVSYIVFPRENYVRYKVVKLNRPVSASQLKRLLALHLTSIKRLVLPWPRESTHLEVGFLLRCFQQLSVPHIATQRIPLARELAY